MEEGVGEGEFKSLKFMWMGLMWMPPTMWNHAADGFEHQKLEHVSDCKTTTKALETAKIGVEEGVDVGLTCVGQRFSASGYDVIKGNSFIVPSCCVSGDITSNFYMGRLPMKTKFKAIIDYVASQKQSRVQ